MEILSARDFTSRSSLQTSLTVPRIKLQNLNSNSAESSDAKSSPKTTTITEDSPQIYFLKRFTERFKLADELLKLSPKKQRALEKSFRLKTNTSTNSTSHTRKATRRETCSQISQQIIEEKLESSRTPKRLIDAELFKTTRKFWKVGSEEKLPPEQKQLLIFKPDDGLGLKINPEAKLLKHVVTDNKIINRNWGIDERILPNTASTKRSVSLCGPEPLNNMQPKQCDFDVGGQAPNPEEREVISRLDNLKSRNSNDFEKTNVKSVRFSSTKTRASTQNIQFFEKVKEILRVDDYNISGEESKNSSRHDMDSTMNTISSQKNLLAAEFEPHSAGYRKSLFSMTTTTSLEPDTFSQATKGDLELSPVIYSKSTSKPSNVNPFSWNIENSEIGYFKKAFDRNGRGETESRSSVINSPKQRKSVKIILPQLKKTMPRGLEKGQSPLSPKELKSP